MKYAVKKYPIQHKKPAKKKRQRTKTKTQIKIKVNILKRGSKGRPRHHMYENVVGTTTTPKPKPT